MSTSAGDLLSADEVIYGRQHYSSRSSAEPRQTLSNDRRMFASEDGSLVFSDAETDGVAIAHVRIYHNARMGVGYF